jgi:hypothetical protein
MTNKRVVIEEDSIFGIDLLRVSATIGKKKRTLHTDSLQGAFLIVAKIFDGESSPKKKSARAPRRGTISGWVLQNLHADRGKTTRQLIAIAAQKSAMFPGKHAGSSSISAALSFLEGRGKVVGTKIEGGKGKKLWTKRGE